MNELEMYISPQAEILHFAAFEALCYDESWRSLRSGDGSDNGIELPDDDLNGGNGNGEVELPDDDL